LLENSDRPSLEPFDGQENYSMRTAFWSGVGVAGSFLLSSHAGAKCSFDQIKYLIDGGFSQAQVMQLCGTEATSTASGTKDSIITYDAAGKTFGAGLLELGTGLDGIWDRYFSGEAYILNNKADPTSYYTISSVNQDLKDWVNVRIGIRVINLPEEGGPVGAGLVFTDPMDEYKFASVVMDQDGKITLFVTDHDMVTVITTVEVAGVTPDEPRFFELSAANDGREATFSLDGKPIGIAAPRRLVEGLPGIGGFGAGMFEFQDLKVGKKS